MKISLLKNMGIALCLSCLLIGCNEDNFLDLKDPNRFTAKDFWVSKENAESALAAAYSPIKGQMYGFYGAYLGWLNLQSRGDDIFTILNEEQHSWDVATFSNSVSNSANHYGNLYSGIQRANVILYFIDEVPKHKLNDKDRSMMKGEAHFLRAYQYFLLVSNFQYGPLRTEPSQNQGINVPPATEEQLWSLVESDLKAAIESELPIKRSEAEKGRIEKGAAVFMLAKTYATQHKYEEAKVLLETLMNPPYEYGLMESYADNFTSFHEFNKESLFELAYSEDGQGSWGDESGINLGSSLPQFIGPVASGGWAKLMPSAFIVDKYTKEKKQIGSEVQYEGRTFDERMYASLFFDSNEYGDNLPASKNTWYGGNHNMNALWEKNSGKMAPGSPDFTPINGKPGRFLLKKYTAYFQDSPSADLMSDSKGRCNNVRLIRYAEVLLLHAEACAKTGDIKGANSSLELIRDRAGLKKMEFKDADLMQEIEHQNLLEFFGEGHRFDDLKRWYSAEEISNIFKQNKKQGADNFKAKHMYYPIPTGELTTNAAMQQHPLWK